MGAALCQNTCTSTAEPLFALRQPHRTKNTMEETVQETSSPNRCWKAFGVGVSFHESFHAAQPAEPTVGLATG